VTSLIELGAGFHPELTGTENVYLNGAILGLKPREIGRRMDDIVAFSGLERFMDTPVKRYSSGMYVRLGFAVAAHTEPDVLLVDEVLAVGDASFRAKCMDRIFQLRQAGTTVILVSHNMHQIVQVCDRALLLHEGRVQCTGAPREVVVEYEGLQRSRSLVDQQVKSMAEHPSEPSVIVAQVTLSHSAGEDCDVSPTLATESSATIKFRYRSLSPVRNPIVRVRVVRTDEVCCFMLDTSDPTRSVFIDRLVGEGMFSVFLERLQLEGGTYYAEVRFIDSSNSMLLGLGHSEPFVVRGVRSTERVSGVFIPLQAVWSHHRCAETGCQ
jgi:ABC-type proline/glycine betaine transport system ATPase subunit